jgi:GNAT superfamily N-acetyltransferase
MSSPAVAACLRRDTKRCRYEETLGSKYGSDLSGSESEYEPGEASSAYCSSAEERDFTLLQALAALRLDRLMRKGHRFELRGRDGYATVKINNDVGARGRLVVVLEAIVVKKRYRRTGVATEFVQALASTFGTKPAFSALKVESVLTPEMVALCRKEGMASTDDCDFYKLFTN